VGSIAPRGQRSWPRTRRGSTGSRETAAASYWLTRFLILRLLGLVYLVAFLVFCQQGLPLVGEHGLLPAADYLQRLELRLGSRWAAFLAEPTLFLLGHSDTALLAVGWAGAAGSAVVLCGFANALLLLLLWVLYLSIVHVGQLWYGYGWELQLLETGFLAIFLCPLLDPRPFPRRPPPVPVIWLYRWLIVRIMLGAGLIKLRGDTCWRDLTCLYYHYETQPNPNPLSRTLHFLPRGVHRAGVLFNHLAELVAPWAAFWPRLARHVAGAVMLAFQLSLIASGNLSFLNWLTIIPILACFDDSLLRRVLPHRLVARAERAAATAMPARGQRIASWALVATVAALSVDPVRNLLSSSQRMNTSFNRLALVNSYGAFGSVGRLRGEIVFEGTDATAPGPDAVWREYEFRCKPGDVMRRPCLISPWHYRLDWQIWFAAMATSAQYPWTVHFVWKLLENDPGVVGLLASNPFPAAPPRFVRARLYRYEFVPRGDPSGAWWRRTLLREWLPPLSTEHAEFRRFLAARGWGR
jgi:hypothetical protein